MCRRQVALCTFAAGRLWVALQSGAIQVYQLRTGAEGRGRRLLRLGLRRPVALLACPSFSLVVAADCEGNIALWDTNT